MKETMYYAGIVEEYYNSACPNYSRNGYEKNALIDKQSEKCIFVPGEVMPGDDELLFRCKRANGQTIITLKTPKRKKEKPTIPGIRRYEGEIRTEVFNGYERSFAFPPDAIAYEPLKTAKLTNWDYFIESTMDLDDRYTRPYKVLQQLEERFCNNPPRLAEACVFISYKEEDDGCHDHIFYFSHFELTGTGVCAVYEYAGTCS